MDCRSKSTKYKLSWINESRKDRRRNKIAGRWLQSCNFIWFRSNHQINWHSLTTINENRKWKMSTNLPYRTVACHSLKRMRKSTTKHRPHISHTIERERKHIVHKPIAIDVIDKIAFTLLCPSLLVRSFVSPQKKPDQNKKHQQKEICLYAQYNLNQFYECARAREVSRNKNWACFKIDLIVIKSANHELRLSWIWRNHTKAHHKLFNSSITHWSRVSNEHECARRRQLGLLSEHLYTRLPLTGQGKHEQRSNNSVKMQVICAVLLGVCVYVFLSSLLIRAVVLIVEAMDDINVGHTIVSAVKSIS